MTTKPQPMTCEGATFVAHDANGYSFTSALALPPVPVKSMTNLTIDWSAVTQDFVGHELDTTNDLNTVTLLMWQLPLSVLEEKLNADTLEGVDLLSSPPPSLPAPNMTLSGTSAQVYDFTVNGSALSPEAYDTYLDPVRYPPSGFSYVAAVATGITLGQGFRMLQSFTLDPGASSTTVALDNDSTKLSCEVSLRNLTITGVPGDTPGLTLDYTQLTTNARGAAFDVTAITSAVVGHYAESPEDLEKKFLDLDRIALDYYTVSAIPDQGFLDFTALRDKNDVAFPGISSDGTWLVGLICGNCRNPAPWYMTILKPCAP